MCGIFALIETNPRYSDDMYTELINSTGDLLHHRGPDACGHKLIVDTNNYTNILLLHTRLHINGDNTPQPLFDEERSLYLIINGEIFNWKQLEQELDYKCHMSDCEIILPLYKRYQHNIPQMLNKLNGQFSFVLLDLKTKTILVARDRIGVTPLYIGFSTRSARVAIASELKCLTQTVSTTDVTNTGTNMGQNCLVDNIKTFYPRQYICTTFDNFKESTPVHTYTNYFDDKYLKPVPKSKLLEDRDNVLTEIKTKLTQGVRLQLQDLIKDGVDFGVLLSGGLDSSLITSLVVKLAQELGHKGPIKTFSIGINKDVPDLTAARKVSESLNTDHHEYYFEVEEALATVPEVVWAVESYDCTTVRASTAMYLLTKQIKQNYPEMRVVFSGEMSDELLCYLYGANAPNEMEFQKETVNLVSSVHMFDCLRANKCCMAHSLEVRVPFTDPDYVDCILKIDPRLKMFGKQTGQMEKQVLRDAFRGYLSDDILYRKKEQFSDGVSGFTDKENLFCERFNDNCYKNTSEFTVREWKPKWCVDRDPSGRVQTFWVKN
ncbi:hypothetical protein EBU95_13925 [bacterium]|nr:hypothetical protein [bacterium]